MEKDELNGNEDEQIKYLSKVFFSISDLTRFKIVLELNENCRNVTELRYLTGKSQDNISHNLRILRDRKIVEYRKVGKEHYYEIDKDFKKSHLCKLILEDFVEVQHNKEDLLNKNL